MKSAAFLIVLGACLLLYASALLKPRHITKAEAQWMELCKTMPAPSSLPLWCR